jgi:UDPglucose 6-dehydrogenase
MKIGIIGMGVVGKTLYKAFKNLKHLCYGLDKHNSDTLTKLILCDIIYICLPTNHSIKGLETGVVESYLKKLNNLKFKGIVAIKSTLNPGDTEKFIKRFSFLKKNICFVPEFLRERCSYKDFTKNHDLLLIGSENKNINKKIIRNHGKYPKKISIVSTKEAELIKLYSNAYNAARIVFANSFFEICDKTNVDYSVVLKNYLKREMSTGKYLACNKKLRGFGGKCLPKDLHALNFLVMKKTKNIHFFKDILSQNNKFKITIKKN